MIANDSDDVNPTTNKEADSRLPRISNHDTKVEESTKYLLSSNNSLQSPTESAEHETPEIPETSTNTRNNIPQDISNNEDSFKSFHRSFRHKESEPVPPPRKHSRAATTTSAVENVCSTHSDSHTNPYVVPQVFSQSDLGFATSDSASVGCKEYQEISCEEVEAFHPATNDQNDEFNEIPNDNASVSASSTDPERDFLSDIEDELSNIMQQHHTGQISGKGFLGIN